MALAQMGTVEEAIKALARFHNKSPPGHSTRNNAGLCFSFSGRKAAGKMPDDDKKAMRDDKKDESVDEGKEMDE